VPNMRSSPLQAEETSCRIRWSYLGCCFVPTATRKEQAEKKHSGVCDSTAEGLVVASPSGGSSQEDQPGLPRGGVVHQRQGIANPGENGGNASSTSSSSSSISSSSVPVVSNLFKSSSSFSDGMGEYCRTCPATAYANGLCFQCNVDASLKACGNRTLAEIRTALLRGGVEQNPGMTSNVDVKSYAAAAAKPPADVQTASIAAPLPAQRIVSQEPVRAVSDPVNNRRKPDGRHSAATPAPTPGRSSSDGGGVHRPRPPQGNRGKSKNGVTPALMGQMSKTLGAVDAAAERSKERFDELEKMIRETRTLVENNGFTEDATVYLLPSVCEPQSRTTFQLNGLASKMDKIFATAKMLKCLQDGYASTAFNVASSCLNIFKPMAWISQQIDTTYARVRVVSIGDILSLPGDDVRVSSQLPSQLRYRNPSIYTVTFDVQGNYLQLPVSAVGVRLLLNQYHGKTANEDAAGQFLSRCSSLNLTAMTTRVINNENVYYGTILYYNEWAAQMAVYFLETATDAQLAALPTAEVTAQGISPVSSPSDGHRDLSQVFASIVAPVTVVASVGLFNAAWVVTSLVLLFPWQTVLILLALSAAFDSASAGSLRNANWAYLGAFAASCATSLLHMSLLYLRTLILDLRSGWKTHLILLSESLSCGVFSRITLCSLVVIIAVRALQSLSVMTSTSMSDSSTRDRMRSKYTQGPSFLRLSIRFLIPLLSLAVILSSAYLLRTGLPGWKNASAMTVVSTPPLISVLSSLSSSLTSFVQSSSSSMPTWLSGWVHEGQSLLTSLEPSPGQIGAILRTSASRLTGVECPETCAHLSGTASQTLCSGCSYATRSIWWLTEWWKVMTAFFALLITMAVLLVSQPRILQAWASVRSSFRLKTLGKPASVSYTTPTLRRRTLSTPGRL